MFIVLTGKLQANPGLWKAVNTPAVGPCSPLFGYCDFCFASRVARCIALQWSASPSSLHAQDGPGNPADGDSVAGLPGQSAPSSIISVLPESRCTLSSSPGRNA